MTRLEAQPSVVCTVLEEGGVLLNLDTKFYYSLNRTALYLWTLIEDGHADPAAAAARAWPEAARDAGTASFLAALRSEDLVRPVERGDAAPAAGADPGAPPGLAWTTPQLTRHDVPLNRIMSNPFDPAVPLAE